MWQLRTGVMFGYLSFWRICLYWLMGHTSQGVGVTWWWENLTSWGNVVFKWRLDKHFDRDIFHSGRCREHWLMLLWIRKKYKSKSYAFHSSLFLNHVSLYKYILHIASWSAFRSKLIWLSFSLRANTSPWQFLSRKSLTLFTMPYAALTARWLRHKIRSW